MASLLNGDKSTDIVLVNNNRTEHNLTTHNSHPVLEMAVGGYDRKVPGEPHTEDSLSLTEFGEYNESNESSNDSSSIIESQIIPIIPNNQSESNRDKESRGKK